MICETENSSGSGSIQNREDLICKITYVAMSKITMNNNNINEYHAHLEI